MFKEKNKSTVKAGIDTSNFEILKLRDFIGKEIRPFGFFINTKGKYDDNVILVTETEMISLPAWCTHTFSDFTAEEIEAVKEGKMIIKNIHAISTSNGDTVSFDYDDYAQ